MQMNLCSDYGQEINRYLNELQSQYSISSDHLASHKITAVYRAKMVDWMVEVLSAFRCDDQTFFLAVNIMDRYFDAYNKNSKSLELHDLHLIGMTCMFIASKFNDIVPLFMKTVFAKIGHSKIPIETIRAKELDILRTLGFMVGSAPTPLEFLQSYNETLFATHKDKEFINMMSVYLAKMALHHDKLCSKKSSLVAATSIFVTLKIYEQMKQKPILTKKLFQELVNVSGLEEKKLLSTA